jgi:hypothetical protein
METISQLLKNTMVTSAVSPSYTKTIRTIEDGWEFVSDNIGVDSGQCGFFNIENYRNDSLDIPFADAEGKDFYESYRKTEDGDHWYGKICGYTLRNEQYGELQGVGLVSSSGFGDGSYNLYAKRDSSRKGIALKVKFF